MAADRIFIYKQFGTSLDNYAFEILNLDSLTVDLNTPVTPMPLPEESSDENILVKMEGNSESINIAWVLKELTTSNFYNWGSIGISDDVVLSSATADAKPINVYDQINKIKEFAPQHINDSYVFVIFSLVDNSYKVKFFRTGTIGNISFSTSGDSSLIWRVNLHFFVGNVVSAYNANVPQQPTITNATKVSLSGNTQQVSIAWTEFNYPTGTTKPVTTFVSVKYKHDQLSSFIGLDDISDLISPATVNINLADYIGNKSTVKIEFKLALKSAEGVGVYSTSFSTT